ncbi:MAG: 4Fe-4S ferredoxin [Candidatus Lokiarchaeota archaeon]|nr:4Fe-4S ferredoxin [Candidatus Lokiarchaeota archaeon]MBD3201154.1 4Fe-4S ferredoxin [Candidatus Lokiarchaeota archaeon]
MPRPLWFVHLLKKSFPNVNFIAKLTKLPLLGKLIEIMLFQGDDIIYLPKDGVIEINQPVNKQNNLVLPSKILEYFIEKANYHFIMDFCICRSSMDCQDYPIEFGCLFLGKGTLDINQRLGKRVSQLEALDHIKKCADAGLVHMIGKNRLDKQWLGVGDGDKLLSICNCCPCCCLWRISSVLNPKIGQKIKKIKHVSVKVNDNCVGCGTCLKEVCFVNAIEFINNRAHITEECRGCGRCVEVCPQNAINLRIDDDNYVEKSINSLDKVIDVT